MAMPEALLEDLPPRWRQKPHPKQAELSMLAFSADELLADISAAGSSNFRVVWSFAFIDSLAFIEDDPESRTARITLHSVLNHPSTPLQVIAGIFKHEVLHLTVRPREIDGKLITHPPEFWEKERELIPEMSEVWFWLWISFHSAMKRDEKRERMVINAKRAREIIHFGSFFYGGGVLEFTDQVDQEMLADAQQSLL